MPSRLSQKTGRVVMRFYSPQKKKQRLDFPMMCVYNFFWPFMRLRSSWQTGTGWRRPIGCLISWITFRKRATNYRALLRKMTYKDKASYESSPPCRCSTIFPRISCLENHDDGVESHVRENVITEWQRLIGSPKLQIIFHKRSTKYMSLLQKRTYKDKASYEVSPPCRCSTIFPRNSCSWKYNYGFESEESYDFPWTDSQKSAL